ncbi:MAG TPA: hypothetical protein VGM14_19375 [Streptosporangiaceae bacterium]
MDDAPPPLKATSGAGETPDPTEQQLLDLLETVESEESDFLIVERTGDPGGQTYAQAALGPDGGFLVEHREGDAQHHYGTVAPDLRTAWQLLAGWAFERPGWDAETTWSLIQFDETGSTPPAGSTSTSKRRLWSKRRNRPN